MNCIQVAQNTNYMRDFINLSRDIYTPKTITQNDVEIKALLCARHRLSTYFTFNAFIIYQENRAVGRFAITRYHDDDTAYLGFFECIDDDEVAKFLFKSVDDYCQNKNFKRLLGPVDASFWLKYRLKTNLFNHLPYTGEPYNPAYYLRLFKDNGYRICERYTSSIYPAIDGNYDNPTYRERYRTATEAGYQIVSPTAKRWRKTVDEIYTLITTTYCDFPTFKMITHADFCAQFNSYKKIVDYRMVKMAYYRNRAVGFYISLPNYHNRVYLKMTPYNLFKIWLTRRAPKGYVMLYMGVDPAHKGLGKALAYSIIQELKQNRLPSVGALQRQGNITQSYVAEQIADRYSYALLEKEVSHAKF